MEGFDISSERFRSISNCLTGVNMLIQNKNNGVRIVLVELQAAECILAPIRYDPKRYDTIRCNTIRYDTIQSLPSHCVQSTAPEKGRGMDG
mmetsp:Transcript_4663/g.13446  ORF Transcript_4663/g.13446 Transcript_4663/m.13446 type:complete len:91 (-) Transcript_4663:141-413(-)